MRLLPDDLAASLTTYREPGRAELPKVFRATSAPIVRAAPNSRTAKTISRRNAARADARGAATSPGGRGVDDGNARAADDAGESRQEKEEDANMARIVRAAEDALAKSGGGDRGAGDAEDGGGDGALKTSIRARLPAPSDPEFASDFPGGASDGDGTLHAENNDESCDFVSSTVWSGAETTGTIAQAGEE